MHKIEINAGNIKDFNLDGGSNRTRTCDPLLVRQML